MMEETAFAQKLAEFTSVMRPELLAILNGQLKRGTLEMTQQNLEIVGIDMRMLRRAVEKVFRVLHNILIERRAGGHKPRGGRRLGSSGPPRPLPRRSDRTRISSHNYRIERADIDPQLE